MVKDLNFAAPKTKDFAKMLASLGITGTVLVIAPTIENNLKLSARNVPGVEVTTAGAVNTYQVLKHDKVIVTQGAFEQIETRLAGA